MWYWYVLGGVLLIGIALLIRGFWENSALQKTQYAIADENLPESFQGLKIAHLSDFHNNRTLVKKVIAIIKQEAPDFVVITGDLIDRRRRGIENAVTLLKELVAICPVYFATGNHEAKSQDFPLLEEQINALGVISLRNRACEAEREGEKITLVGLEDMRFEKEAYAPKIEGVSVLLAHRPLACKNNAFYSLAFCGHAHGGQFRFLRQGLIAPDEGFFPKYTAGVHTMGQMQTVISRGLGNGLVPIRLFNRPEVVFVTLNRKD